MELLLERRRSRRFQIVLPVLFRWTDSVEHYGDGALWKRRAGRNVYRCGEMPSTGSGGQT